MTTWGKDKRPLFGGEYPYEATVTVYLPEGASPESVNGGALESRGMALLGQIEGYRRLAGLPSMASHCAEPDGTYFEYGFIMGKPFVRVWPGGVPESATAFYHGILVRFDAFGGGQGYFFVDSAEGHILSYGTIRSGLDAEPPLLFPNYWRPANKLKAVTHLHGEQAARRGALVAPPLPDGWRTAVRFTSQGVEMIAAIDVGTLAAGSHTWRAGMFQVVAGVPELIADQEFTHGDDPGEGNTLEPVAFLEMHASRDGATVRGVSGYPYFDVAYQVPWAFDWSVDAPTGSAALTAKRATHSPPYWQDGFLATATATSGSLSTADAFPAGVVGALEVRHIPAEGQGLFQLFQPVLTKFYSAEQLAYATDYGVSHTGEPFLPALNGEPQQYGYPLGATSTQLEGQVIVRFSADAEEFGDYYLTGTVTGPNLLRACVPSEPVPAVNGYRLNGDVWRLTIDAQEPGDEGFEFMVEMPRYAVPFVPTNGIEDESDGSTDIMAIGQRVDFRATAVDYEVVVGPDGRDYWSNTPVYNEANFYAGSPEEFSPSGTETSRSESYATAYVQNDGEEDDAPRTQVAPYFQSNYRYTQRWPIGSSIEHRIVEESYLYNEKVRFDPRTGVLLTREVFFSYTEDNSHDWGEAENFYSATFSAAFRVRWLVQCAGVEPVVLVEHSTNIPPDTIVRTGAVDGTGGIALSKILQPYEDNPLTDANWRRAAWQLFEDWDSLPPEEYLPPVDVLAASVPEHQHCILALENGGYAVAVAFIDHDIEDAAPQGFVVVNGDVSTMADVADHFGGAAATPAWFLGII